MKWKGQQGFCLWFVTICISANLTSCGGVPDEWSRWPEEQRLAHLLQEALNSLPLGQVVINCPHEMKVNHESIIHVQISTEQLVEALSSKDTLLKQVKVSPLMRVRITAEPSVAIRSLNNEQQIITANSVTDWSFGVTPSRDGKLPLYVNVTAVLHISPGEELYRDYPLTIELVNVRVGFFTRVHWFISRSWQSLSGAGIIGSVILTIRKLVKARRSKLRNRPRA